MHPHLEELFKGGSFAAVTFNLGGQVMTIDHRDTMNKAVGECPTFADGRYNHELGGHLILWDFNIAIEFPACGVGIDESGWSQEQQQYTNRSKEIIYESSLKDYFSAGICKIRYNS